MTLSVGFKTDVGRRRKQNEDSYAVLRGAELNGELDVLFVVADGMGGRRGGEVASRIVAQTILETAQTFLEEREQEEDTTPIDVASLLQDMVTRADLHVRNRQDQEPDLDGMGTTCVAAILDANLLTVANVGDSRAYLLREGRLTQITEDHSEVQQEVKAGHMTREEAQRSRFRNVITRAIGVGPNSTPDVETHRLQEGDTILLCSDGLTSEVGDPEIARLLAGVEDAQEVCDQLVEAALRHGGKDNITVLVLRYGEFTPIVLPETEWDDEDDTDPIQAWRSNPPRHSYEENEAEGSASEHQAGVQANGAKRRRIAPLVLVLLVLLFLLVIGEGGGLFYIWQNHAQLWPPPPPVKEVPASKRTDKDLDYGAPTPLLSKTLRESPLAIDRNDHPIVLSQEGNVLRIDPKNGTATKLANQTKVPALPDVKNDNTKPKSSPLVSIAVEIAIDASGNRYQLDPVANSIDRYTAEGTRRMSGIGKGLLKSPTALAVDSKGNLYVIDELLLKRIEAREKPEQRKTVPTPHP